MTYRPWFHCVFVTGSLLWSRTASASPTDSLQLVFDESATSLPQERIRTRLRTELDALAQVSDPNAQSSVFVGLTAKGQIRLEYRGTHGPTQRQLARPDSDDRLAELVALAAINLVSDDASQLIADLQDKPSEQTPPNKTTTPTPQQPAPAVAALSLERRWQLAMHAGWWDAGLDITAPVGLFVGVGVPWMGFIVGDYTGRQGVVALDSRLGYAHALSSRFTLYGELLTAWNYDWGDPCGDGCISRTHRLFFFPAVGARYRWASGYIVGADVTLAVLSFHHVDDPNRSYWFRKNISPWVGVAFSQLYVGYAFEL